MKIVRNLFNTSHQPFLCHSCSLHHPAFMERKKNFAYDTCSVGFCFYIRSFVRIGCVSMRIKDNPILRLANKLLPNTRSKTSKPIKSPSKIIGRKKMKKKKCALTELNICSLPLEKVNKMCPRCSTPPLLGKKMMNMLSC